jgi:hypothetical protein
MAVDACLCTLICSGRAKPTLPSSARGTFKVLERSPERRDNSIAFKAVEPATINAARREIPFHLLAKTTT